MKLIDDLRNLDRHNVGRWPLSVKIFFMVIVFVVVLAAGWYFRVDGQYEQLDTAVRQEASLKREFAGKQAKAVQLEALEAQLADLKAVLQRLLRQLPSKTEMPQLLVDISQSALATGLDTELFQPQPEVPRDFYAEEPIKVSMLGSYHQFGEFMSNVAALPRVVIVTFHLLSRRPTSDAGTGSGARLSMQGDITTYRYLDEDDPVVPRDDKEGK